MQLKNAKISASGGSQPQQHIGACFSPLGSNSNLQEKIPSILDNNLEHFRIDILSKILTNGQAKAHDISTMGLA